MLPCNWAPCWCKPGDCSLIGHLARVRVNQDGQLLADDEETFLVMLLELVLAIIWLTV